MRIVLFIYLIVLVIIVFVNVLGCEGQGRSTCGATGAGVVRLLDQVPSVTAVCSFSLGVISVIGPSGRG